VIIVGTTREADEGTAAHLWQLLVAGQVPVIAWHAVRWLPESRRQVSAVLAAQVLAIIAAAAPVAWLGL
jgi:hypothetical protein